MELVVFSLLDTKTGAHGAPFTFNHLETCKRALRELCLDPATLMARYPADYHLVELGTFDDQAGTFRQDRFDHGSLVPYTARPIQPTPPELVEG